MNPQLRIPSIRTTQEKADQEWSWRRPDFDFFLSGACHVLAHAFSLVYPNSRFGPLLIESDPGRHGTHVAMVS